MRLRRQLPLPIRELIGRRAGHDPGQFHIELRQLHVGGDLRGLDHRARRARLPADAQGDRRDQLRAGRVRHARCVHRGVGQPGPGLAVAPGRTCSPSSRCSSSASHPSAIAYRPLRGRSIHVVVIATFGISEIVIALIGVWQGTATEGTRTRSSRATSRSSARSIPWQRLIILVVTLFTVAAMVLLFKGTQFGRQVRAVAADRETAQLYGGARRTAVDHRRSASPAHSPGWPACSSPPSAAIDLNFGFLIMLGGFYAAILGGFGSLGGVVVGGFMIGIRPVRHRQLLVGRLPTGAAVHLADRHHRHQADGPVHQGPDAWPALTRAARTVGVADSPSGTQPLGSREATDLPRVALHPHRA